MSDNLSIWAENAETLAAICGWPEWKHFGRRAKLGFIILNGEPDWWMYVHCGASFPQDGWTRNTEISQHVAICIWRDWVRRHNRRNAEKVTRRVECTDEEYDNDLILATLRGEKKP